MQESQRLCLAVKIDEQDQRHSAKLHHAEFTVPRRFESPSRLAHAEEKLGRISRRRGNRQHGAIADEVGVETPVGGRQI